MHACLLLVFFRILFAPGKILVALSGILPCTAGGTFAVHMSCANGKGTGSKNCHLQLVYELYVVPASVDTWWKKQLVSELCQAFGNISTLLQAWQSPREQAFVQVSWIDASLSHFVLAGHGSQEGKKHKKRKVSTKEGFESEHRSFSACMVPFDTESGFFLVSCRHWSGHSKFKLEALHGLWWPYAGCNAWSVWHWSHLTCRGICAQLCRPLSW